MYYYVARYEGVIFHMNYSIPIPIYDLNPIQFWSTPQLEDNNQMQGPAQNSSLPFTASIAQHMRKHKQPIFAYQNMDNLPRNPYYDDNPYSLALSPSEPRFRPLPNNRNSTQSRQHTESSSQRSSKVIRANGLRLVSKPKLIKSANLTPFSHSRLTDQTRRFMQREHQLESQNRTLRNQNQFLKQKMRRLQQSKDRQIGLLSTQIEALSTKTTELQNKISEAQTEWRKQVTRLQEEEKKA